VFRRTEALEVLNLCSHKPSVLASCYVRFGVCWLRVWSWSEDLGVMWCGCWGVGKGCARLSFEVTGGFDASDAWRTCDGHDWAGLRKLVATHQGSFFGVVFSHGQAHVA